MKKVKFILALSTLALLAGCGGESAPVDSGNNSVAGQSENSQAQQSNISVVVAGEKSIQAGKSVKLYVTLNNDTERAGFNAAITSGEDVISIELGDSDITVKGLKEGSATIKVSSVSDPNAFEDVTITVIPNTDPKLEITADSASVAENGTIALNAVLSNVEGSMKYKWTSLYGKGSFVGVSNSATINYKANTFGSDTVQVEVQAGSAVYRAEFAIVITSAHTGWKALATAEDVKTELLANSAVNGNYYLTADIDLGGYEIPVRSGNKFSGKLDGQGHSIKNFKVLGEAGSGANGGFFGEGLVGSVVSDVNFDEVEIPEAGSGWGTAVISSAFAGTIENVSINVLHSYNSALKMDENSWFPFCAGIVGVAKEGAIYKDIVVDVDMSNADGAATMYADTAYPAGTGSAQTFKFINIYTNSNVIGGQTWDWGTAVNDSSLESSGIDWSSCKASDFALNANLWELADGQKPALKVLA